MSSLIFTPSTFLLTTESGTHSLSYSASTIQLPIFARVLLFLPISAFTAFFPDEAFCAFSPDEAFFAFSPDEAFCALYPDEVFCAFSPDEAFFALSPDEAFCALYPDEAFCAFIFLRKYDIFFDKSKENLKFKSASKENNHLIFHNQNP